MARYWNGQPITLTNTIKDRTGTLVDAGAHLITIQNPDLTTTTFTTPTHDSTGTYHQDVAATSLTQNGHYMWKWVTSGVGAGVLPGEFDVADPLEPSVLSLPDAKVTVNINPTTTTYDAELQSMIDTVTASLETITGGPAFNRSVTEYAYVSGDLRNITLRQRPVVSVTSITDIAVGTPMSIVDIDIDPTAGIIRRKLDLPFWSFLSTRYQIVYVAGWGTAIPAAFNVAARLIVNHLWRTARGPGLAPVPNEDMTFLPGMSFAIPNRALEVMRPYSQEVYV